MSTLMVSVSGIRGIVGDGLDPAVLVKYCSAFADFCGKGKIIVGRDARITGEMVKNIVSGVLSAKGNDIIDIGICPTPSVLFNVKKHNVVGGIAISASHNPNEWNALKLINASGEFMTPEENADMLRILDMNKNEFVSWDKIGKIEFDEKGLSDHIEAVLKMPYIDLEKIKSKKFRVLLDCVNGAGSYIMPDLLEKCGCEIIKLDCEKNGIFPRLPEPLPENLTATMEAVKKHNADLAIVVDPDVDRLVLITDKGEPFGEENTITSIVNYILANQVGNVTVNLSTTRAVDDVAKKYGCKVFRSPVGEANVVKKMKETNSIIGGEGSGGVIFPSVLFGRDALVGTVLTLQYLAFFGGKLSEIKDLLPQYFIAKKKIELGNANPDNVIEKLKEKYADATINTDDGLRLDFEDHWVHFRKSNTEPIIRCICESITEEKANNYIDNYFNKIKELF